ncbi:hypothetical protein Q5E86_17635 [Providencia sp. CRE-138-0111]|uniref:Uncharacterized protein n=1 Tax=Providencia huashanensis TaxID=3037798 RepID=A0ABT9AVZ7_9GAMM|nr:MULTISPECIES: hypothetical protein [Providencia]MDO7831637.1 hypothetical protein [Providencia sp. CRE-138-0026]MDO7858126.1 hypothetical protein [Providencia sp. CRE-138-0111]
MVLLQFHVKSSSFFIAGGARGNFWKINVTHAGESALIITVDVSHSLRKGGQFVVVFQWEMPAALHDWRAIAFG